MDLVLAGRYELEVPLGKGSSGEVWRGSDMATHRPVAIKLVELAQVDDASQLAQTIERFRREAAVIAGTRHPNIVGAIDAGRIGNRLFIVMELAPGISLAAMMDERAARDMGLFPVSSVLRIAEQVCTGLAAAHTAGIVHRDIKPSNLMVTPSLGVKIIDFGTARLVADNSTRLTLPAQTVGTIAYMSPEQAQGLEVDGRGDLYSLGCVLYQLLSGHPPFFSTLPSALLMMQVMDRAVPLGTVRPELPAEVCQLVSDLMEKEREARPADAQEVVTRIAAIRETLGYEETEFEADRQTIRSQAVSATQFDSLTLDGLTSAAGRSTVLTPERMTKLSEPDSAAPGTRSPAAGQLSRPLMPFQSPFQSKLPAQSSPVRSAPQTGAWTEPWPGPGAGAKTSGPQWPAAPPPPPRRTSWGGVFAVLVAAAVVASAGSYYWVRTHTALKITHVAVSTVKPEVGCSGTAHLVGTITTDGHAGAIQYEWILNGKKEGVANVTAQSGSGSVRVTRAWTFHDKGKGTDYAYLDTLSPQHDQARYGIPYTCPR